MLTISSPHINFGHEKAAKILARKVNEDGAEIVKKYPNKFGLIASIPLPNVEDSIEEIKYAMDVLHVDGFALPTNAQGVYLGDPCTTDPIFQELNKRKAVVVIHPNKPSSVPENVNEELPIPAMEFLFDTTRTVTNMIFKELRHFPNIKFIIPHAGAFLSILLMNLLDSLEVHLYKK